MYKSLSILSIFFLFIFLFSCAPANYFSKQESIKEATVEKPVINNKNTTKTKNNKNNLIETKKNESNKINNLNNLLSKNITVLISEKDDPKIVNQFLKSEIQDKLNLFC